MTDLLTVYACPEVRRSVCNKSWMTNGSDMANVFTLRVIS